tara:strand:- start:285 stop:494 length:210 start_codon:yes stop_codon:yes gene_type:complete
MRINLKAVNLTLLKRGLLSFWIQMEGEGTVEISSLWLGTHQLLGFLIGVNRISQGFLKLIIKMAQTSRM